MPILHSLFQTVQDAGADSAFRIIRQSHRPADPVRRFKPDFRQIPNHDIGILLNHFDGIFAVFLIGLHGKLCSGLILAEKHNDIAHPEMLPKRSPDPHRLIVGNPFQFGKLFRMIQYRFVRFRSEYAYDQMGGRIPDALDQSRREKRLHIFWILRKFLFEGNSGKLIAIDVMRYPASFQYDRLAYLDKGQRSFHGNDFVRRFKLADFKAAFLIFKYDLRNDPFYFTIGSSRSHKIVSAPPQAQKRRVAARPCGA